MELEIIIAALLLLLALHDTLAGLVAALVLAGVSVLLLGLSVYGLVTLELKLSGLGVLGSGVSALPLALHLRRRRMRRRGQGADCRE